MEIAKIKQNFTRNSLWFGLIFLTTASLALISSNIFIDDKAVLAALGAILLVFFTIKPEFGVYSMIFLLPFTEWHLDIFGYQVALVEAAAVLAMAGFLSREFFVYRFKRKIKFPLFWPVILFIFVSLLSAYLSENSNDSLYYALRWILFFYVFYVVLPFNVINDKNKLQKSLAVFILSGFMIAVIGAMSLVGQDWQHSLVRVKPTALFGFFPLGETQNMIVEPLIPPLFYVLVMLEITKKESHKKLLSLMFIFLLFILIATFSRGAWLALISSAIIYTLAVYRQSLIKILIPLCIIGIILIPFSWQMIRLQTDYHIGIGSTASRLLMAQIAYQNFLDYPFLGKGPGEFINTIGTNIRYRANFGDPMEAHGVFQKVMLETGAAGIVSFALILLLFFKKSWNYLRDNPNKEHLLIFLGAFAMIFFELFDVSYYRAKLWIPITLALIVYDLYPNMKLRYGTN